MTIPTEIRIGQIIIFFMAVKFNIGPDKESKNNMMPGNKYILMVAVHWCLQNFERLQGQSDSEKYLIPVYIRAEFMENPLVSEVAQRLKELQVDF